MPAINLPYVDAELSYSDREDNDFWRHFHWGYYPGPHVDDDSPGGYLAATEALTEHLLTVAGVQDGRAILDVGCGFGGTLDHIRGRNRDCALHGVNIDHRQVRRGRRLLADHGLGGGPVSFATADGCRLPVADGSVDHVLAVECVFHFPSRKAFLAEAARVLRPGGTVALSDFVAAPGALGTVATRMEPVSGWYGHLSKPITLATYRRISRACGLEAMAVEDITTETLPTYPALRRLHRELRAQDLLPEDQGDLQSGAGDALEDLALGGQLGYHILAYRKP